MSRIFDGVVDFLQRIGYGANNALSQSGYALNRLSTQKLLIDRQYRGSWVFGNIVDAIPDDMTRCGISIQSDVPPEKLSEINERIKNLGVFSVLNRAMIWGRLYGGSLAVIVIEGERYDAPLDIDRIRGKFRGLIPIDRYRVIPSVSDLVGEPGIFFGTPKYYTMYPSVADTDINKDYNGVMVHYTRVIKFVGISLPYWDSLSEAYWGAPIGERIYDRILGYDRAILATSGIIEKVNLRTLSIDGLRNQIAAGGVSQEKLRGYVETMRIMQGNEGITIIDKDDEMSIHTMSLNGVSDIIDKLQMEVSAVSKMPVSRIFGQTPSGLSASGDHDLKVYYEHISSLQESTLRPGIEKIVQILFFEQGLKDNFTVTFNPLYNISQEQLSAINTADTNSVMAVWREGLISDKIALMELKQRASRTGYWTNITDDFIRDADSIPTLPDDESNVEME